MILRISPSELSGSVLAPPSKSVTQRLLATATQDAKAKSAEAEDLGKQLARVESIYGPLPLPEHATASQDASR